MAVTLTVNGSSFSYPSLETDTFWGAGATGWAQAVTNGMLQKAGGSFTLIANVDFGASFGLKSLHFSSRTSNPSSVGLIRLANVDTFGFRNAANSADLLFSINPANDHLLFAGVDLSASSSSGNVVGPVSSVDNTLPRFSGTTGQIIQGSGIVVDDSDNMSGVEDLSLDGDLSAGGALSFASIGATSANLVGAAITTAPTAFSPTFSGVGGGTAPTFATSNSTYYTLGKMVFVTVDVSNSSGGTAGSGGFQLQMNLPVNPRSSQSGRPVGVAFNNITVAFPLFGLISSITNTIKFFYLDTIATTASLDCNKLNNSSRSVSLSFFYEAA